MPDFWPRGSQRTRDGQQGFEYDAQPMGGLVKLLAIFASFFAVEGLLIALGAVRICSRSDSEADIAEGIRDIPSAFNLSASQLVQTYEAFDEAPGLAYNDRVGLVEGPYFLVEESNHSRF